MRILIVSNLYPPVTSGGYEVICADVAERLGCRHEVQVLTSSLGAGASQSAVRVIRELPLLAPTFRGSLRAPLASLAAARITRRVIEDFRPELVFVWNGAVIPQVSLRLLERSDAMVAYSVAEHWFGHMYRSDQFLRHLFPGDRGPRRLWAFLMRALNRFHPALRLEFEQQVPAAIVWNSRFMQRNTPVPDTVEPIVQQVSYPATSRHALFSQVVRRPAAKPTVLFVGRLEHAKGPDIAYRAVADLLRRWGIQANLVMVGAATSTEEAGLARLAAELGIAHQIELTGQLAPETLAMRLGEAHVFLMPSRWAEPFGLVSTEAALARVPVVAARSGGIPEALHEDEHALFFDKDDYAACADALAATFNEPDATVARVARAFAHACEFTSERHLDEMEAFIDAAVVALSGELGPVVPNHVHARINR